MERYSRREFILAGVAAAATMALPGDGDSRRNELPSSPRLRMLSAHGHNGPQYTPGISHDSFYEGVDHAMKIKKIATEYPNLPMGKNANAAEWVNTLGRRLTTSVADGEDVLLLGYSLGTRAVMLLLNAFHDPEKPTYNPKIAGRIADIVFLAAFDDNNPENANRFPDEENYHTFFDGEAGTIKPAVFDDIANTYKGRITVMHERKDPKILYSQGEHLAQRLNATLIPLDGSSHFEDPRLSVPVANRLSTLVTDYQIQKASEHHRQKR